MAQFVNAVKRFVKEEDAPTMVEYGLLVALIALVVAIAASVLGLGISGLFVDASNSLTAPAAP